MQARVLNKVSLFVHIDFYVNGLIIQKLYHLLQPDGTTVLPSVAVTISIQYKHRK